MKLVHNVVITVFSSDDADACKKTLAPFVPFSLEEEKLEVQEQKAEGFQDRKIIILSLKLVKARHTNAFLKELKEHLSPESCRLLLQQIESRLDERLNFFIRFDKQELLSGRFMLTDGGDCFHIKMSIAAFPHKRPIAKNIIKEWLTR
ncbi:MAG: RNA-binding domain-containing protein [Nanoarchaeota archaeon]